MSSVINPGKFRRWTTIRLVIYISRANVGLNLIFWVSRIFIVLVSQEESDKWLFLVWVILNAWMLFWNNHKKLDTTIFWIDWIFLSRYRSLRILSTCWIMLRISHWGHLQDLRWSILNIRWFGGFMMPGLLLIMVEKWPLYFCESSSHFVL